MAVTPDFHADWGGVVRRDWPAMFAEEGMVGAQELHFLEIGCFEGRTTLWLLENVLTHPTSRISVIDTFEGSPEFVELAISPGFRDRFLGNVLGYADRVTVYEGRSHEVLPTLEGPFDFVFVDGSHVADDVWTDGTLAWPLLKRGRLLAFDDYLWGDCGPSTPHPAIRRFLSEYAEELDLYHLDFHCIVRKL